MRFTVLLFIISSSYSYPQWNLIYPPVTEKQIIQIYAHGQEDWFTGFEGLFLKRNVDNSYKRILLDTNDNLHGLFFLSDSIGWVYGDNGTLFSSHDNWEHNNKISISNQYHVHSFYAFNSIHWWMGIENDESNSILFKTTNGGASWIQSFSLGFSFPIKIFFVTEETGFVLYRGELGGSYLIKTTDRGDTWYPINTIYNDVKQFFFTSENIGWILNGLNNHLKLYKTTDGGVNWINSSPSNDNFQALLVLKDKLLLFTKSGSISKVFKSSNEGITWNYTLTTVKNEFMFRDSSVYYDVGWYGYLLRSSNSGINWLMENPSGLSSDCFFINADSGWASSGGDAVGIFRTTNSGVTWSPSWGFNRTQKLFRSDANNIFFDINEDIYRSTDDGLSWQHVYESQSFPPGDGIKFLSVDSLRIYLLVYNLENEESNLIFSNDGGNNWGGIGIYMHLRPSDFVYNNQKMFVICDSVALVSTNLGNSWISKPTAKGSALYFIDQFNGWLCGTDDAIGYVKKTTDGGETFDIIYQDAQMKGLSAIFFFDELNGILSGLPGTFSTTDGGKNWQRDGYERFRKISKLDNNTLFGYSTYGGIYHKLIQPVPVELSSFKAIAEGMKTIVSWVTQTEKNNELFELQRKEESTEWSSIFLIPGHGTTLEPQRYSYIDNLNKPGMYLYRLKQKDYNGAVKYSETVSVEILLPKVFSLSQNYPNPFNPTTEINYSIPFASHVTIKVYDLLGREISTLLNGLKEPGTYTITFNASFSSSGVYFYKLEAGNYKAFRKMILLR